METLFIVALLAVIGLFIYFPRTLMVLAVTFALAVACSKADAATRFEVAAVIESEADRSAMQEAADAAARIYRDQLGVDLVVMSVDVDTIAADTHAPTLLRKVQDYRMNHLTADATVFFTRRELRGYAGIATEGPACSAGAAAVVTVRADGYDGQILAHELAHTVGVPHDSAGGYLMSVSPSRAGSDYMSPDSVLTFKGAPIAECMTVASTKSAEAPQAAQGSTGGGGAFGATEAFVLLIFVAMGVLARYLDEKRREAEARVRYLEDSLQMLEPPGILDVMHVAPQIQLKGKWLGIQFATLSGLESFRAWVIEEHRKAVVQARDQISKAVK